MAPDKWLKPGLLVLVPIVIFSIIFLSRATTPSVLSAWLSPDIPAQISFPLGTASQIYSFSGNPGASTLLTLNSPNPSVSFTAEVRSSGQRVAMLGGGLQNAVLTLGPGNSLYEVEFKPGDGGLPGTVSLMVSGSSSAIAPAPTNAAPQGVCSISSATDGGVNIRSGPSFDYAVLAVLPTGQFLTPDARTDNTWYRVHVDDQIGWVLGSMVTLHGPCGDLLLQTPIPSVFSITPVPIAATTTPCTARTASSLYVNVRNGPGLNYSVVGSLLPDSPMAVSGRSDNDWYSVGQQGWVSGSVVILEGQCDALPVNTPAQPLPIAPYDSATFAIVADRDGSNQVNEVISYPDGDRADLIEINVANLYFQPPDNYREFSVSLVCTGTGSEQVRWGAPENPVLSCGSIINIPFLYDYHQQVFAVILPDGSQPGYVTYTLAAVASR